MKEDLYGISITIEESGFLEGASRRRYKRRNASRYDVRWHEQHEGARSLYLMSAKLHVYNPSEVQPGSVERELFQGKDCMHDS